MTHPHGWTAPTAVIPVRGRVRLPGSPARTLVELDRAATGTCAVLLTDPADTAATLTARAAVRDRGAGVSETADGDWLVVPAGVVDLSDIETRRVETDLVVATGFLAAAAVTTGTVVVRTWPVGRPGGDRVRAVLADLGTYVVRSADGLTCTSRSTSGELTGVRADLRGIAEVVPVVAVLAALAQGPTRVRVDDDPRVAAVVAALTAVGGRARVDAGDVGALVLVIEPVALRGGTWPTAGDAGLALAGAVLGLRTPGTVLDDIGPLTAEVPGFTDLWTRLLWADEHLLPGTSF